LLRPRPEHADALGPTRERPDNVVIPGDTVPTTWIVAAAVGAGRSAPEGILRRRGDVVGF